MKTPKQVMECHGKKTRWGTGIGSECVCSEVGVAQTALLVTFVTS